MRVPLPVMLAFGVASIDAHGYGPISGQGDSSNAGATFNVSDLSAISYKWILEAQCLALRFCIFETPSTPGRSTMLIYSCLCHSEKWSCSTLFPLFIVKQAAPKIPHIKF